MPAGRKLELSGIVTVAGVALDYRFAGPQPGDAPTLMLLHEGLGSAGLWGDFLPALAQATGAGVFAWSRAGYGQSDPVALPRPITYMHEEAQKHLPALLDHIGFQDGLLIGHSDGASIAAIYAGSARDKRVKGLVLIAPHFFIEDVSVSSIAEAKMAYENSDLREKLSRWHKNVDVAFRGWNEAWLNPDFHNWNISEFLPQIDVPVLAMQGADDQYGTLKQIEIVGERCGGPVRKEILAGVKHSPHREAAEISCALINGFYEELFCETNFAK